MKSFRSQFVENINLIVPLRAEEYLYSETETFVNNIQQVSCDNTLNIHPRTKGNNYPKEIREKRRFRKLGG